MKIRVLFGTESGNSEMIADDVAGSLPGEGIVEVADLQDVEIDELSTDDLHLVICSTYGEGEVPASAQPFVERLSTSRPDLAGILYAMFGLGDSGYADSYSRGSEIVAELLDDLGAQRVGEFGRHDAAGSADASETATAWARRVLAAQLAVV